MTTVTSKKREMQFDTLEHGCRLGVYIDGHFKSSAGGYFHDHEAAKDNLFRVFGFDRSLVNNEETTTEELNDDTKTRRFMYYGPTKLDEIVQFCSISEEGNLEIEDEAFENHDMIVGFDDYLMKYYLDDIKKSMAERKKGSTVIAVEHTTEKPKESKTSGSAKVNHVEPSRAVPATIPPHYIPDNAGFDANHGFMIQDGDGNFKPNFAGLVGDQTIPASMIQPAENTDDLEEYRMYIKTTILNAVNEMISRFDDKTKAMLNNDKVNKLMNKLFDELLSGNPEEVNARLSDDKAINTFITNFVMSMMGEAGYVVTEEDKKTLFDIIDEDNIKEVKTETVAVINQPEEENVLGDKPVDNSAMIKQYPILGDVEKLITFDGAHGVKFAKDDYGMITAAVYEANGTYDEVIESKSFTMDLDKLTFNKDNKFWPGINNSERPDFRHCYTLKPDNIVKFRDGHNLGQPLFGASLPKLNKYVDIRTLFDLVDDSFDMDLAQKVLIETKRQVMPNDRVSKRFAKNRGIYTNVKKLNDSSFEFTLSFNDTYPRYVGGDQIKNTGSTGDITIKVSTSDDSKVADTK